MSESESHVPASRWKYPALMLALAVVVATGVTFLLLRIPAASAQAPSSAVESAVWPWAMMAAAISVSISVISASYAVAMVGSAAVGAVAEKPELIGRVVILVGLAEGIAIYGLIVAVLILNRLG